MFFNTAKKVITATTLSLVMCGNVFAAHTSERSVIKVVNGESVLDSDGTPANSSISNDGPIITMEPEISEVKAANGTEFRVNMKLSNMNDGFVIFAFERAEESYNADGSASSGSIAELQRVEYGNIDDFIIENKTDSTQLIPSETSNELIDIKNAFIEYNGSETVRASGESTLLTFVYKKTGNGIFKPVIKDLNGSLMVMSDLEMAPVAYIVENTVKLSDADGSTENSTASSNTNNTSNTSKSNSGTANNSSNSNNENTQKSEETTVIENNDTIKEESVEETTQNTENITAAEESSDLFDDIASRAWARDAINELAKKGIVNGVGERKFAPDNNSKRADFIIIADKILGLSGSASDNFSDVRADKYYANYVGLAKEVGIASGYSDNTFAPENTITRQDMMVLVGKMLEYRGVNIEADQSSLDKFADKDSISEYAKPYIAYLTQNNIVSGTGDNIEPKALMTRAQMSVLMKNVYDKIGE